MANKPFNAIDGYTVGPTGAITVVNSVGNVSANFLSVTANANLGNYATANYFSGDGGLLTNISATTSNAIANGTSNVRIPVASGNINLSVGGTSNVLVVTTTGVNVAGTLNATGNANVGNLGTSGIILSTGNITGSNLLANSNVYLGNASFDKMAGSSSIDTWVYTANLSVGAQEINPYGVTVSLDGSNLYITGTTSDSVHQYTLSSPYELSSATFIQSKSVAAQDTVPNAVEFKTDGTKMYMLGDTNNRVWEYNLSTAWNISTATVSSNVSVAAQDGQPFGLAFKSDGARMYILGAINDAVFQYNLSTAWDVTTATYSGNSFSVAAQETAPEGLAFNDDGTQMFVCGTNSDYVLQYNLSSAWDITTASYLTGYNPAFSRTSPSATPIYGSVWVASSNNRAYLTNANGDLVYQFNIQDALYTNDKLILDQDLITANLLSQQRIEATGPIATYSTLTAQGIITGLSGLSITGNANTGNIGATTGVFTSISGTLTTASQTNITAVGTLGNLTVTSNTTSGNFIGVFANGTSNVNIPAAAGNINMSVGGTSNVLVVTTTGANITGTLNATGNANVGNLGTAGLITVTGNITGSNLISNNTVFAANIQPIPVGLNFNILGSRDVGTANATGIPTNIYGGTSNNAGKGGTLTLQGGSVGNSSSIASGGDVYVIGQTGGLLGTGGNIYVLAGGEDPVFHQGSYAIFYGSSSGLNGNAEIYGGSANGTNIVGGSAIISGGKSTGNANAGLILFQTSTTGASGATPQTYANRVVINSTTVNIVTATNSTSTVTGALVVAGGIGISGNLYAGGIASITGNANVGNLGTTGNITAGYFFGNGSQLTGISATTASALANGTSNVSIPVSGGNVNTSVGGTSNVLVVTTTGVNVAGTLNTGTGNANVGNLGFGTGIITGTGNITSGNLLISGNGNILASGTTGGNLYIKAATQSVTTSNGGNIYIVSGNGGTLSGIGGSLNILSGSGPAVGGAIVIQSGAGTSTGTGGDLTLQGGQSSANITGAGNVLLYAGSVGVGVAQGGSGASLVLSGAYANGSVAPGFIIRGGTTTGVSNNGVEDSYIIGAQGTGATGQPGNLIFQTGTPGASGNTQNTLANRLVLSNAGAVISGNATAGNFIGTLANGTSNVNMPIAGGNINMSVGGTSNVLVVTTTGANITGTLNATGNANVGNLGTTGNITAGYYFGNGSQLTGISATTASALANGTSNVSIPAAGGNVNTSVGGTSNVLVVTTTGANITGTLNATGNANVGNIGATTGVFTNISGTLTTASQTNITAIGTLGNLTVTSNTTSGNFIGIFANSTSNIRIPAAAGNINMSVGGTSNILVVTTTGSNIAGTLNVTGNATVGNLIGTVANGTSNVNMVDSGNVSIVRSGTTRLVVTNSGVTVTGAFSATSKSFLIDHPTEPGMQLQYGSLESPYHGVRLTGEGVIKKGKCVITLPTYIKDLVHESGAQVQITNYKHGKVLYVDSIDISKNEIVIKSNWKIGEYRFFWSFTAIRKDVDNLNVEF